MKNAGQATAIKHKICQTNLQRRGCSSTLADPAIIEQSKQTKKVRQQQITEKTIQSNLKKYGVACTLQVPAIKERVLETLLRKHGVTHNSRTPSVKERKRQQLFTHRKKSLFEDQVIQHIRELGWGGTIERNNRSIINPMEIDIWIPELKLGIECNGCYWHSDPWKPKDYHLAKTQAMHEQGFKLIQLFDYEWNFKRSQVSHRLHSALGLASKISARSCQVKKISLKTANELLSAVHLQGTAVARHNYGLYYQDQLVAVMNFAAPRFNKKFQFELIRYASACTVVGGASRLLRTFIRDVQPNLLLLMQTDVGQMEIFTGNWDLNLNVLVHQVTGISKTTNLNIDQYFKNTNNQRYSQCLMQI